MCVLVHSLWHVRVFSRTIKWSIHKWSSPKKYHAHPNLPHKIQVCTMQLGFGDICGLVLGENGNIHHCYTWETFWHGQLTTQANIIEARLLLPIEQDLEIHSVKLWARKKLKGQLRAETFSAKLHSHFSNSFEEVEGEKHNLKHLWAQDMPCPWNVWTSSSLQKHQHQDLSCFIDTCGVLNLACLRFNLACLLSVRTTDASDSKKAGKENTLQT